METLSNGDVATPVKDAILDGEKYSGWLFLLVPGGWFRKKWVKKWGVLRDERIYLHDSQMNNNNTKNCMVFDLLRYQKCADPGIKEIKKFPHSFELEADKPNNTSSPNSQKKKTSDKPIKELFRAENESEKEAWVVKIKEGMKAAKEAEKLNLDHVTKSRPKPKNVRRRPPTRHHLRQVATQSQLLPGIDIGFEITSEPTSRSSSSTPLNSPKSTTSSPANIFDEEDKARSSSITKPVPSPLRKVKETLSPNCETDGMKTPSRGSSPVPPPTPSKSLKPKLLITNDNNSTQEMFLSSRRFSDERVRSLPRPIRVEMLKTDPEDGKGSWGTASLDRRNFDQLKVNSVSNSLAAKSGGSLDGKIKMLETQGIKLPVIPADNILFSKRKKAKSMALLDRDLPPPEFSEVKSASDMDLVSEHLKPVKKPRKTKNGSLLDVSLTKNNDEHTE